MSSGIDTDKPNQGAALTVDVRTNFIATKTELDDLHRVSEDSVTAVGTDTITATYSPVATGPTSGQLFGFKAANTNTGAVTFNPDSLGPLAVQAEGVALGAGQIQADGQYILKYDGSVYQLLNPSARFINGDVAIAGGVTLSGVLRISRTDLVIVGNAITVTRSYHRVDTNGMDPTDDLDTINGGVVGDILVLTSLDDNRDVTLRNAVDNIVLSLDGDFTLTRTQDTIKLVFDGTSWLELSRSNNS